MQNARERTDWLTETVTTFCRNCASTASSTPPTSRCSGAAEVSPSQSLTLRRATWLTSPGCRAVDGAIHSAAGPDLYRECRTLHGCETGETKLTKGYRLPATHVAHTVGPIFAKSRKRHCEEQLRSCYRTTLDLCAENGIRSVAFSGISTGM